jgi:hypothetical protein
VARKSVTKKRGPVLRAPKPIKVAGLKPARFADYLTLGELSVKVNKDKDWLRKLERRGTIPPGIRHRVGKIEVRLYPPSRVREIEAILKTLRPGRPRKNGG